ncbi:MAG: 50S ribosomal protein L29 [bacterium]
MKAVEIRELTEAELRQRLQDTQKELFNLRVQQSYGQLEKSSRIRELRRDVARINTVITQRRRESKTA